MNNSVVKFLASLASIPKTELRTHFGALDSESKNQVLAWLYLQSQNPEHYSDMQGLSVLLLSKDTLPKGFMSSLLDEDKLSFFFLALQTAELLSLQNHQGNTLLHLLFANPKRHCPPFNFIRSLLLFERNEAFANSLTSCNQQNLTPIETYLAYHPYLETLPVHELGALLALMEIQKKQQPISQTNLSLITKHLSKTHAKQKLKNSTQRMMLLAAFYGVSEPKVVSLL
jgi:hypothetical protein